MNIFVWTIWVCKHPDIKFDGKNGNFANISKLSENLQKMGQTLNLPDFLIIFNIFGKLIFALKFNIWVLTHTNNMHKNVHKVIITG